MVKSLLSLKKLETNEILDILKVAKRCEAKEFEDALNGKIVANLFFEPSTRTQYSFNTAETRLGMKVINFAPESSSLKKGETFYDTIKTFESFGLDSLVIRDQQNEYYNDLVGKINIPILNAGDGTLNHPTQSLLDLYTIYEEFKHFDGLKIAIVGDVKHSRVAHTNIEIMQRLGMEVYISGPKCFDDNSCPHIELEDAIKEMDIIMLLRIQHERHQGSYNLTKEEYHQKYGITMDKVQNMKEDAIIMHPAPFNRNVELSDEVAECSKARIFNQMQNGVYVRMAILLRALLGENNESLN